MFIALLLPRSINPWLPRRFSSSQLSFRTLLPSPLKAVVSPNAFYKCSLVWPSELVPWAHMDIDEE